MTGTCEKIIQWLFSQDREKIFEIKEYKEKRSLNQNSYCWKLITEMANVLRLSKEEVYLQMLKSYGQSDIVIMISSASPAGYVKYYEEIGKSIVNNKEFTHYKFYKGSSEFDTKEMSIFIDGIVQECTNLGIPTLTPDEIKRLNL